ncbi:MAG: cytidine(C)-cytidine(C)-adenosine (A)]-adding enzyme [Phycisphaerae bacterium]|nr:MAG: CCA tRNA nucleotidyltransferase [Planctomycetia bacterium]RIK70159.1 MAG: metal-dependent phosphohydrolase [Planctomycetota bacterium]GJQ26584.1 MAG: cytidine(C)-cytidine(C)-adenosine (A)]-adding enzyme [Phycisphaerae bacterium]
MSSRPARPLSPAERQTLTPRGAALRVVRALQTAGHVAYFAGGCVRDMLLGKRPDDYDVATSAEPREVIRLFRRTQQVGAKFGVVLVRIGPYAIETATFRTDGDYADGRRPAAVRFTDARHDAARRDFTINGMFYDPIARCVIDHVDGQNDLKRRVIRAIGSPDRRFAEDHLRLLRAIRFAARLDFEIERGTWAAMREHAPAIARISPERIWTELIAMFEHPRRAKAFSLLHRSGVLFHLWPQAQALRGHENLIEDWLGELPVRSSADLCLAVVLHAMSRAKVGESCDALRCSNQTRRTVTWVHEKQNALNEPGRLTLADLKLLMAHEAFGDLVSMFAARLRATEQSLAPYRRIRARIRAIPQQDVAPRPLLTGDDLARLNVPRGPIYKKVLDQVYYAQLNGELSTRESAHRYALELLGKET